MATIALGDVAKDTVTGFQGVVVGRHEYLHGCVRLQLQPQELKDGKPIEACTFDEPQLTVVKRKAAATTSNTGGPRPEPTRPAVPRR